MSNHNKELDERGTWVIDFTEKKITQQLTEEQIEEIKKGDKILWIPGTRKVFSLDSKQAEKYFNYKKGATK